MALQLSTAVRNARLDALETVVGTSAQLTIFAGSIPANCSLADAGTALVVINLPSDWMNAASGGTKAMAGSWAGTVTANGTATYFRIKDSTGTTTHAQGSVSITGGGGDVTLSAVNLVSGKLVNITGFTITDGNV